MRVRVSGIAGRCAPCFGERKRDLFYFSQPGAYIKEEKKSLLSPSSQIVMIEVVLNDRLGKKIRVKCNEDDTIGDLKKLVAAQTGTRPEKIRCVVTNSFPNSSKFVVVVVFSSSCS